MKKLLTILVPKNIKLLIVKTADQPLVAKGKNKKLAAMAVANKLLKQVFEVVRTETLFDRNYYKKIA